MSLLKSLFRQFRAGDVPGSITFAPSGVAILSDGPNASIAYLLEPHLARQGIPFTIVRTDACAPGDALACRTLIIARYLPPAWIDVLHAFKDAGGRLVYFMDDDLMDPAVTRGLPEAYRRKIARNATRQRALLERLCDEFWVASPYLAAKYQSWSPTLLSAQAVGRDLAQHNPVTVCYHGTASHGEEIRWLAGVMEEVLMHCVDLRFELFGDLKVNRMFRGMPRVSVLHPMDWLNYKAYGGAVQRDIALAPLLPHPFNAGRGPTKFFDIARLGAVGIYSDLEPYRGYVRDGVDGVLLANDVDTWVAAIGKLAADPARRRQLAANARERSLAQASGTSCARRETAG